MRYSRQREALLELLRSTTSHPDAQWLYSSLRQEQPNISLGTVYRNLRQLTDEGEILELCYGNTSHFDADLSPHYHLQCSHCKRIFDIPADDISVKIRTDDQFTVDGFSIVLNGTCRNCQNDN